MLRLLRPLAATLILLAAVPLAGAQFSRQISGLELSRFPDREVLVIRTEGKISSPGAISRNTKTGEVSFICTGVGADDVAAPAAGLSLIRTVSIDRSSADGARLVISLARPELADQRYLRFSQPSDRVLLFEVFPGEDDKQGAASLREPQLPDVPDAPRNTGAALPARGRTAAPPASSFDPERLGLTTVDLRSSDPQRVLGLAASTGLLRLNDRAVVATEHRGEMSVKPGGQSVASWSEGSPPGELYLSGSPEQIADFLRFSGSQVSSGQPTIQQVWKASRSRLGGGPKPMGGRKVAGRPQLLGDPYGGLYYTDTLPGGTRLSDIRVTLPATDGADLFDVLNMLSEISGISLMIDPYALDEPTGSRRPPKEVAPPEAGEQGPGFRSASVFDPNTFSTGGSVIGNFVNVPFDQALQLILETHELEYVVYGGAAGTSGSGSVANSGNYDKPVILITSRERLNQELEGSNEINLQQFHYADPGQFTDMLDNFNMLPGTNTGWYIYQGSGGGGNGGGGGGGTPGGGGGGNGGGGSGGGGGGGVGGGGTNGSFVDTAKSGLLVYRGATREPIYRRVTETVEDGKAVIRVLLAAEEGDQYVTAFSL